MKTDNELGRELAGDMPAGSEQHRPKPDTVAPETDTGEKATGEKPKPETGKGAEFAPADFAHLKDKFGFRFDPAIHETKKDGSPKLSKNQILCRRPGRRVKQSASFVAAGPEPTPGEPGAPAPGTEAAHYQASGEVMAQTLFAVGAILGGEEWAPKEHERTAMADAWANYFRAKGVTDIPPGVAVAIAMGSYTLPRFAMPQTRRKVGGVRDWWKNRKKKKAPHKAPEKQEG